VSRIWTGITVRLVMKSGNNGRIMVRIVLIMGLYPGVLRVLNILDIPGY